jgi:hypothetical protein
MKTHAVAATPVERTNQTSRKLIPGFSRLVMFLPMLIMVGISLRFVLDPVHAAVQTGVALSTPEAMTDTRVVGAIVFTLTLVVLWTFLSSSRLRIGHAILMTFMGLILIVRIYGFIVDGTTLNMGAQKSKTVGEVVFLVLNFIGFVAHSLRNRNRTLDIGEASLNGGIL